MDLCLTVREMKTLNASHLCKMAMSPKYNEASFSRALDLPVSCPALSLNLGPECFPHKVRTLGDGEGYMFLQWKGLFNSHLLTIT